MDVSRRNYSGSRSDTAGVRVLVKIPVPGESPSKRSRSDTAGVRVLDPITALLVEQVPW